MVPEMRNDGSTMFQCLYTQFFHPVVEFDGIVTPSTFSTTKQVRFQYVGERTCQ